MSHLYVIQFSNGAIKVGRSTTPKARINTHRERVACVGIGVDHSDSFECAGDAEASEAMLIGRCKSYMRTVWPSEPETIVGSEWFSSKLGYAMVRAWAHEISEMAVKPFKEEKISPSDLIGDDNSVPMTRAELSFALSNVSASDVAELADISTKTVYRIRQDPDYMPNMGTVGRIEKALKALGRRKAKAEA